ncbi:aminotransferase class V-fold PLP-dependent enzyme [Paenibacillus sp. HJGM_3]|uniref:aminotransferase class V-fold PLP-dependent enzyme n=1 Tax=Paenibacillus sp. HJGM_3 TaxID=3379816 RepID=UPI00385C5A8F
MQSLIDKSRFIGLEECTWLYSGAETPALKVAAEAVQTYMRIRSLGPAGRENNARIEASCKANVARLLGGKPEEIAFLSNSSEIVSMIAGAIDFKPGDNVVIHTLEFPAGVLPWLLLKEKGVTVRVVNHTRWQVTPENIMAEVDSRTRIVMTSHVSYYSGARLDYRSLYARLKQTDTLLLLDATQSLGAVSVDMYEADFVVCSSYKWLLSVHGLGILGVNPTRLSAFMPKSTGWRAVTDMFSPNRFESFAFLEDARRFETGYPSYPTVYALNESVQVLLDIGVDRIERHILDLGSELIGKLTELGYEIMTPAESERRAGNICILSDSGDELAAELQERNIYVWGGDGRFRVSIHLFNDSEDIARLLQALDCCRRSSSDRTEGKKEPL